MTCLTIEQQRAVDRRKDDLVKAAEDLLEKKKGNVIALDPKKFGHSQLRNVIAVATETESAAVVSNFIRYQIGRDTYGNSWAANRCGKPLGQLFIDEIDGNQGVIMTSLAVVEKETPLAEKAQVQSAKIELIRQFLGFASRHMKYIEFLRKHEKKARKGGS